MELTKDIERVIAEAVARAIESTMKLHTAALEEKISASLDVFSNRLDNIEKKISKMDNSQAVLKKSVTTIENYANNLMKENNQLKKEHEILQLEAKENLKKIEVTQRKLDDLEQYGRKTMLEINGFPRKEGENTTELTLSLAWKMKVDLKREDIEACHRLSGKENAGIIVELGSRVKRDAILVSKKHLKDISTKDFGFDSDGLIFINESLTPKRKSLIRELKSVKKRYGFNFIWSRKGIIFIRRDENSHPIRINSLSDLNKTK